jgi:hypothetical protein
LFIPLSSAVSWDDVAGDVQQLAASNPWTSMDGHTAASVTRRLFRAWGERDGAQSICELDAGAAPVSCWRTFPRLAPA